MTTRRKQGSSLLRWRDRSRYVWRYDGILAKAKEAGTLTPLSRHYGLPVTDAEAAARVRLDAERVLIAEAETRIRENKRRRNREHKERMKRLALAGAEAAREEELAELMQQAA